MLDLRDYVDRSGSRVPEGTYTVRIADAELGETKAGAPRVSLYLEILSGPYAGQTVVDRLVIQENTRWRVVAFLKAIGISAKKVQMNIQFNQIIGKRMDVQVVDNEYNGSVSSQVKAYAPAAIAESAPASDFEVEDEAETAPAWEKPASEAPEVLEDADSFGLSESVSL